MRMTAGTIPTRRTARTSNARMARSSARPAIASRRISVVTAIETVAICRTRRIVHPAFRAVAIVPNHDSNVTITCAWPCRTFAMERTTAAMGATSRPKYVRTSIAIHCDDSNVPITGALPAIKYVTE